MVNAAADPKQLAGGHHIFARVGDYPGQGSDQVFTLVKLFIASTTPSL
jgi:hypothetical protein